MTTVTVLTPTIATDTLANAVRSVANQKVAHDIDIRHIVVADGKRYENSARDIAMKAWEGRGGTPRVFSIPDNTGAGGWNGHKIYAHYAQLLDTDYLCLLDEDNTFEPEHIDTLLPIAEQYGYAWSLRNVYTKSGERMGVDRVESTGRFISMTKINDGESAPPYILVDTSCWMLRRDFVQYLAYFLEPWSGDRTFTKHMAMLAGDLAPMGSGLPTMNYYAPDHLRAFFEYICTEQ
jgi:GT2 family glycosyltransferase